MDKQLEQKLRSQLEEDRARLEAEAAELRDYAVKATTYLEDESDAYDNHPADDASSLTERTTDMTLLRNLERELTDVKEALNRMDQGTYGICENCGKPISEKRLQARPMATTCIDCQTAIENRQRREAATQVESE